MKTIQTTFKGKIDCSDRHCKHCDFEMFGYYNRIGKYKCLLFNRILKMDDTIQDTKRCKKCLEAEVKK